MGPYHELCDRMRKEAMDEWPNCLYIMISSLNGRISKLMYGSYHGFIHTFE